MTVSDKALERTQGWSRPLTRAKAPGRTGVQIKSLFQYLGPAFVVSVAYIDPGNFGTNISGGSLYNLDLLWVILASNLVAIFMQILSAKLGIATGMNLPQLCGRTFTRPVNWVLWCLAQVAAMATDLAEFLGAALGFNLLLAIPLGWAGLLTGLVTFVLVHLEKYGHRLVEGVVFALIAVISGAYFVELFLAQPDWSQVVYHAVVPRLTRNSLFVAVGMLGATVMPHVIYLHSHLIQSRRQTGAANLRRHLFLEKIDVFLAMNTAFVINAAMVVVSAAVFHNRGLTVLSIEEAHRTLQPLLGSLSSTAFAIALLASGLSSSAVGTMAGQVVMDGFVDLKIPIVWRRLLTMAPALIIIGLGLDPMYMLLLSQVILSFTLPAAIIPLLVLSSRRAVMGDMVNTPAVRIVGWLMAGAVIFLNLLLLMATFT
ncbi:divalent metal cation transporter MntH [Gelria sp. Kuro-4]|nr:Nramp family divalent metal transporter [Gelria sp. Kuro-4]BCV25869.1 divalent metal cation transporter MntH [Gelria sp. Kuro-4]